MYNHHSTAQDRKEEETLVSCSSHYRSNHFPNPIDFTFYASLESVHVSPRYQCPALDFFFLNLRI